MMEVLTALVPYAGYAVVIAATVVLINLVFDAGEPGLDGLFQIELDPPMPRGVQEEEPVRWNVERLRRPSRADAAVPSGSVPIGTRGLLSAG